MPGSLPVWLARVSERGLGHRLVAPARMRVFMGKSVAQLTSGFAVAWANPETRHAGGVKVETVVRGRTTWPNATAPTSVTCGSGSQRVVVSWINEPAGQIAGAGRQRTRPRGLR
jgi:hypothetical protein